MQQTAYAVKIYTRGKIFPLKCKKKENSRTFKHHNRQCSVFQGFLGLEKEVMNFTYFQALQGPVRALFFQHQKPCGTR